MQKTLSEWEARAIINTGTRVAMKADQNIIGHLVGERHLKGVAHFRFKPEDPQKNEVFVPVWDIFRV